MAITRDDLFEDVKYGRMTPAEAEAKAARLGLNPLALSPEPQNFDPMNETWWSLPMAIAWIIWRDPDAVLEHFDPYRAQCTDWHYREWRVGTSGSVQRGHFLETREPATLRGVEFCQRYNGLTDAVGQNSKSFELAMADLWKALQSSAFEATGVPLDHSRRQSIPDIDWSDLTPGEEAGRDVALFDPERGGGYTNVLLRRQDVVTHWRAWLPAPPQLPPTIRPEGPGYFPLTCAAQWIATEGGSKQFDPSDDKNWKPAFDVLLAHISSGEVKTIGSRSGVHEEIHGHVFASLRVDYPLADSPLDLLLGDELYLEAYPYLDEEHWQKGFNDTLQSRSGVQWSKLMVLKSDIAKIWKFGVEEEAEGETPDIRTGGAGRPTPMFLIIAEHSRRIEAGALQEKVTQEAEHLAEWLKINHPKLPSLTPKTIRMRISEAHRKAIARRK